MSRRDFLKWAGISALALVRACSGKAGRQIAEPAAAETENKEAAIERIKELKFAPGSELRTTIFPRKIMWEKTQVLKAQGKWMGGDVKRPTDDESDWTSHSGIMEQQLEDLAKMGIKGGRLAVVPFELTEDGTEYRWEALDRAVGLMGKYKMKVDLCVGPFGYPYGPEGARLPVVIRDRLVEEMEQRGAEVVEISMGQDGMVPESSEIIRAWGLDFVTRLVDRYGKAAEVDKITPGNEYPDINLIEGGRGKKIKTNQNYMKEVINIIFQGCDKKIALNTNIHPADWGKIRSIFGPLLADLGDRAVLGLDSYKTEELKVSRLAKRLGKYGEDVEAVRRALPGTEIVFMELQAEPWPEVKTETGSWEEIERKYKRRVMDPFFVKMFPSILESHVLPSGITEVGLWGAPLWLAAQDMRDDFPARLIQTTAETMARA